MPDDSDTFRRADDHATLARIDERTQSLAAKIGKLEEKFELYLSRAEWWPYKAVIVGLVGLVLSGVGAALIALVVRSHA